MLTIAHRGYHADEPENSLEAFAAALALEVDGIETDVRLSADHLPVLMHDRHLGGLEVGSLTQRQLSQAVGHHVPTLDEALARFAEPLWVLEIKTPQVVEAAVAVIERYARTRRLLVISFWHPAIDLLARRLDVDLGVLACLRPLDAGAFFPAGAASSRIGTIVWNYEFIDEALLAQAAARGLRNFVYGVETLAEHERCAHLGLKGLITDHPQRSPR